LLFLSSYRFVRRQETFQFFFSLVLPFVQPFLSVPFPPPTTRTSLRIFPRICSFHRLNPPYSCYAPNTPQFPLPHCGFSRVSRGFLSAMLFPHPLHFTMPPPLCYFRHCAPSVCLLNFVRSPSLPALSHETIFVLHSFPEAASNPSALPDILPFTLFIPRLYPWALWFFHMLRSNHEAPSCSSSPPPDPSRFRLLVSFPFDFLLVPYLFRRSFFHTLPHKEHLPHQFSFSL